MKDYFLALINDITDELGVEFDDGSSADQVAQYAAGRAAHLATIVHEPGFEPAVRAERDNVMLRVAIKATESGDAADQAIRANITGMLQGALAIGGRMLALPGAPA